MKTLLRLDSSARVEGSHSRELGDRFVDCWREKYPETRFIERDLATAPIPHLENETIAAFYSPDASTVPGAILSEELLAELETADHLLLTSPLYNLSLPSTLKSWIDHVVVPGRTFRLGSNGWEGMLHGKEVTLITSRGGVPVPDFKVDYQTEYLLAVLAFIGLTSVKVIAQEGTMLDEATRAASHQAALAQIAEYFG